MTSIYSFIIPDIFSFYGVCSCRDKTTVNCSVNKGGFVPAFMLLQLRNITGLFLFCFFVFGATAPPVGQGLLLHEVSKSHITTHHSR
jgi:hypothetical protein